MRLGFSLLFGNGELHYNYFRSYDPSTGRYLESDPIGLIGGLNTYGYALQSPTNLVDPLGLDVRDELAGCIGNGEIIIDPGCVSAALLNHVIDGAKGAAKLTGECVACAARCSLVFVGFSTAELLAEEGLELGIEMFEKKVAKEFLADGAKIIGKTFFKVLEVKNAITVLKCTVECV